MLREIILFVFINNVCTRLKYILIVLAGSLVGILNLTRVSNICVHVQKANIVL